MNYVISASNLWANVHGLMGYTDSEKIGMVISDTVIEDFVPSSDCHISVTDEEEKNKSKNLTEIDESNIPDLHVSKV